MDGDGDGLVTQNEFMKLGELDFTNADDNADGRVSVTEFEKRMQGN